MGLSEAKQIYRTTCYGITIGIIWVLWGWSIAALVFFAAETLSTWKELN